VEAFLQAVRQLHELCSKGKRGSGREIIIPASSAARDSGRRDVPKASARAAERAVERAKAYVSQNFAEKISAREVADLCNMSPFHFSRSFRRLSGITFSEYLLEVRIRKAIELLSRSTASVTGACYEVGFRDPSYFSRIFKRYAGITPSQYRDRYLKSVAEASGQRKTPDQPGDADTDDAGSADVKAELLLRLNRR
jgi:AraC-like DNA-binding protein